MTLSILKPIATMAAVLLTLSNATPMNPVARRQDPSACTSGNDAVICGAHGDSAGAITVTQGDTVYAIVGPSGTNPGYISTVGGAGPTGAVPSIAQVTGTNPPAKTDGTPPPSTGGEFYPIKASVEDDIVNDSSSVTAPLSTGAPPPPPASTLQTATTPVSTDGSTGGSQGGPGSFGTNFPNAKYPMTCPVPGPEGQAGYLAPGGSTSGNCESSSSWCTGDMTLYETAKDPDHKSSCGDVNGVAGINSDDDLVVAIPIGFMNKASMCGKTVQIYNPASGISATAQVVDSCGGCQGRALDMSHGLYDKLSGNRACGRIGGIQWYFTS